MFRIIISAIKWALTTVLVSILLVCAVFIWAQTRYGREALLGTAGFFLKEGYGLDVEVSGLTGTVPFDMKMERMVINDGSGQWLEVRGFRLNFSPLYLIKGRLSINEFSADSITLSRIPALKKGGNNKGPLLIPSMAYHIGLKRLNISRLSLGEEILGRPADFNIEAGITEQEVGIKSHVYANMESLDGVEGSAFLNMEIEGSDPYITIEAGIDEPGKGIIGALMGMDGPLSAVFTGAGRITDWHGELNVDAGELIGIEATVDMDASEEMLVSVEGTARIRHGLVRAPLDDLFKDHTKFRINAHIKGKKEILLKDSAIESDMASLEFDADVDTGHMNIEGSFKTVLKDISPLGQMIKRPCSGALTAQGDFNGPLLSPAADIRLAVSDLMADGLRIDEFSAKAFLEPLSTGSSGPSLHVNGRGEIQGLCVYALSDTPIEKAIEWGLDATIPQEGDILIDELTLKGSDITADISGLFNMEQVRGDLETHLKADAIDRYSGMLDLDIPAGTGVEINLKTGISGRSLAGMVDGRITLNDESDAIAPDIMGLETGYEAYITLSDNGLLSFERGMITSEKGSLSFSGIYDLKDREMHGHMSINANDLASFSRFLGTDIRGAARIDADLDGTMAMMTINSSFTTEDIFLKDTGVQALSGSIYVKGQPLNNQGSISFSATRDGRIFKGASGFGFYKGVISFNAISIDGPGFTIKGDLAAGNTAESIEGVLDIDLKDLSLIGGIFGRESGGAGSLHLEAGPVSGKNTLVCIAHGDGISDALGRADTIDLDLRLSGDMTDPEVKASASMTGFSSKETLLRSLRIDAGGISHDMKFSLTGEGQFVYGIIIRASGSMAISPVGQSLTINSLQGEYGILPIRLTTPFMVKRSVDGTEFQSIGLYIAGGTVSGQGRLSDESMDFSMNFNDIPASLLDLVGINQIEGNATGSITLSGPLGQPEGKALLTLNDMRLRDAQYINPPPLGLTFSCLLKSERLEADLVFENLNEEPFKMNVALPMRLSLSPLSYSLPQDEEISGSVSGRIDLTQLTTMAGIYDQKLNGGLSVDLDIAGTSSAPVITGDVGVENGGYENYNTGTLVKDITMDISIDSNRFVMSKISGTDGDEGKVSGKGWFDFSPSRMFPYSLSLNLKNMIIYRSNTLYFTVSGKPTISGTLNNHDLEGKLTIVKGEYRIPERLPAEVTDLEVTEINGPVSIRSQDRKQSTKRSVMNMDLAVESPGQFYLTGRGLNSEWKGDLTIKGPSNQPVITGRLSVLRGSYNFLGKRFEVTDGKIDLDGSYPMRPILDVTGEAETSDNTVIISLSGELKKPDVTLTSDDSSLPSDEVLSQLLFGKDVSQITPIQAIELGNALNSMMGKSRYDIMGSTRKMLGVDQLELVQSEEEDSDGSTGSAVSVGKYIRDDLYIELEKGLGTETGKASFTWEVTPNITVDTELNENSSTGVGVNWKWDY